MAGEAFEIMKRASIFMIVAQTIIYFRPQESYEKYLRFLIHLMLIVVLFFPVVQLVSHSVGNRMQNSLEAYTKQMEQMMDGVDFEPLSQETAYISTIQKEIILRLNNYSDQTGYVVETAEIQGFCSEEKLSDNTQIKLYLIARPVSDAVSTVKVDKVKWKGNSVDTGEKREPTEEEKRLKIQFAQILGMEQYNLEVLADEVD